MNILFYLTSNTEVAVDVNRANFEHYYGFLSTSPTIEVLQNIASLEQCEQKCSGSIDCGELTYRSAKKLCHLKKSSNLNTMVKVVSGEKLYKQCSTSPCSQGGREVLVFIVHVQIGTLSSKGLALASRSVVMKVALNVPPEEEGNSESFFLVLWFLEEFTWLIFTQYAKQKLNPNELTAKI